MFRNTTLSALLALCAGNVAFAEIEEWGGAGSGYQISQVDGTILITAAGTYKFQSYDGETPDDIEWIRVQSGVTGTVRVHIYQDPNDGDGVGAANVKEIDLSNATTSYLDRLYISGNTATLGDVVCDYMTDGDIDIGGNLGKIGLPYTKLSATTISGAITVGGTLVASDTLEAGTLGNVTIYGSGVTPVQGDIHVINNYSGTLLIDHKFSGELDCDANVPGAITITGVTTGLVNVDGNISGTISIDANLNDPGRIVIDGDVSQSDPNVPAIQIHGKIGETAEVDPNEPRIEVGGTLGGVIAVDGALENSVATNVEIQVGSLDPNDPNSLGAIAVDYDGWQLG
jgi:hypothetical protein